MKTIMSIGVLMLLLASGFIFVSYDRADDGIKLMSDDDYKDTLTPAALRELDRVNKLLGVNPSDLANPRSRSVSQQARTFVAKERQAAAKATRDARLLAEFNRRIVQTRTRIARQVKLTRIERISLSAREQLRVAALARGRGFTRLEGERFIKAMGGSISGLRSATRKGFRVERTKAGPMQISGVKVDTKKFKITLPKNVTEQLRRERQNLSPLSIQQINTTLRNFKDTGQVNNKILNIADIVTLGAVAERKIDKDQNDLNTRVNNFNNKFGGKELTDTQFNNAQTEQKFIDSQQTKIDNRRDKLANSKKDSIRDFLVKFNIQKTPRLTTAQSNLIRQDLKKDKQKQSQIKSNQPTINNKQKSIGSKNKEIKSLQGKKGRNFLDDVKLLKLKGQVRNLQSDIARLEFRAPPKIILGEFPIIPATRIPSTISKISFVGAQKVGKDGKIVTDIFFRTQKGTTGVAKGVTVIKKGKTFSVVTGRTGKVKVDLLTGKLKIRGIQSFVGTERGKARATKFTSESLRRLAKFKKARKIKAGELRVIRSNIKGLEQVGLGRIATVRGKKFFHPFIRFPSGKLSKKISKGIDLDDFASVAAVLTKKELSFIIGKTITAKGRKAEFIGLIKNIRGKDKLSRIDFTKKIKRADKISGLSVAEKQQFSRATQKVFSSVAAAVAKAEKTKGITTRPLKIAAAASILSRTPSLITKTTVTKVSTIKPQTATQVKRVAKLKTQQRTLQASITRQRARVATTSKQRTRQITRLRSGQKIKLITKQNVLQRAALAQKTLQRLVLRQRTILKQIRKAGGVVPRIVGVPRLLPIPRRILRRGRVKKKLTKPVQVFDVFGKVKGKFIKLNIKPLTRADALSKGAFAIDRTTARTFKIAPKGKSKDPGKLLKSEKNYFNRQGFKLREVRIKKGRKFQLKNKYIEKTKFGIDTRGEKSGLTITRFLKQRRKLTKTKARKILRDKKIRGKSLTPKQRRFFASRATITKRKMTPTQRKKMLSNLAKARKVRIKKLKGGKKK